MVTTDKISISTVITTMFLQYYEFHLIWYIASEKKS
jgi:hypothetical protein